jgi:hypothetical protein
MKQSLLVLLVKPRVVKLALFFIWIATIIILGLFYIRQGILNRPKPVSNNVDSDSNNFTGVEIFLTVPNANIKSYQYNIHLEWKWKINGTLADKPGRNLTIDCKKFNGG